MKLNLPLLRTDLQSLVYKCFKVMILRRKENEIARSNECIPVTGTGTSTRAKETFASLAAIIASATSFIIAETLSGDRNCESTVRLPVLHESAKSHCPFLPQVELVAVLRDFTLSTRLAINMIRVQKGLLVECVAAGRAIVMIYLLVRPWSDDRAYSSVLCCGACLKSDIAESISGNKVHYQCTHIAGHRRGGLCCQRSTALKGTVT